MLLCFASSVLLTAVVAAIAAAICSSVLRAGVVFADPAQQIVSSSAGLSFTSAFRKYFSQVCAKIAIQGVKGGNFFCQFLLPDFLLKQ
jgi:hypothetical protein